MHHYIEGWLVFSLYLKEEGGGGRERGEGERSPVGGFLFSFASWLWWSSSEVMLIEFEPIMANILTPIISVCGSERSIHTLLMVAHLQAGCGAVSSPALRTLFSIVSLCI